jgi:predicted short-subunit dehydrogenase-like oxidoreductase (DUF2520 family)
MNEIEIRMLYHLYGGDTIKIGFIGPGKVGISLGRYFTHKGLILSGFYGSNTETTTDAAKITKSKFYDNIQDIIKDSDILFITTPDDIISIIDKELSKFDLKNKSICHASGSLKSNVLCNAKQSGALVYSIHPIYAFSNKNTDLQDMETIYFSIEGDYFDEENSLLGQVIKTLGNKYFLRDKESSSIYHLANVFVSNLTLSLLDIGTSYLKKLGLNEAEALQAIKPLVQGNIESIVKKGFVNSLTGPVLRGDITTIEKHLSVLEKKDEELYKSLSLNLLSLVAKREENLKLSKNEDKADLNNLNNKENSVKNLEIENSIENLLSNSNRHKEIYKLLGGLE